MSDQHRRYTAADLTPLPWPVPRPTAQGTRATTWVLTFGWPITRLDADVAVERVRMHDPSLEMDIAVEDDQRMVVTFTWNSDYDGDALSRSAVALQLLTEVIGRPVRVLGQPIADWPFLKRP
jgi:hypothetical protein